MTPLRSALFRLSRLAMWVGTGVSLAAVLGVPVPGSWGVLILQLGISAAVSEVLDRCPSWPSAVLVLVCGIPSLFYALQFGPANPDLHRAPPECVPHVDQSLLWMRGVCMTVLATFGATLVRSL